MKPVKAEGDELRALVEWIWSQGGGTFDRALAQKGAEMFKRDDCDECHSADGKTEGVDGAPNFAGHASLAWIERLIRDGGAATLFSDHNEMAEVRAPTSVSDEDVARAGRGCSGRAVC